MSIVLDTGVLVAASDASDAAHRPCASVLEKANKDREKLLLPALVLCETADMLEREGLRDALKAIVEHVLNGALRLEPPTAEDLRRALDIEATYRVGLTDATVAALAERTQSRIATIDRRHFSKLRTARKAPFKLVP